MFKRLLIVIWALTLVAAPAAAEVAGWSREEVAEILARRVDEQGQAVGIVVGLIDREGSQVVAHGKRHRHDGGELDGDSVFEIGSVTKVFTATLLADLVARGVVELNDPVGEYLPESVRMPTRDGKEIELYHLTTHTSGLPRMPDNFTPANPTNPYADYSVEQMYAFLSSHELGRDVGELAQYSNLGVGLLGHALARAAGMEYEKLARKRLARPLGMKDTAITLRPDLRARLATGHGADLEPTANWDIPTLAGAGAYRSTVNDMLRFVAANLGLKKTKLAAALRDSQQPREPFGQETLQIGLGWIIRSADDRTIHWHNGGTGGYHSFVGFDTQAGTGVVVLSNCTLDIDDIGMHLLDRSSELASFEPPPEVVEVGSELLDEYVGRYQLAPQFVFTVTREGTRLFIQATGQGRIEAFPESETKFFAKVVDAQISFGRGADGAVDSLTLHQGGANQRAGRIGEDGKVAALEAEPSIELPAETLERYVGRYELQPGFILSIRRDGARMYAQLTGQPEVEIFAAAESEFFYKVVDARLTFHSGEDEAVGGVTLKQGGVVIEGSRLE